MLLLCVAVLILCAWIGGCNYEKGHRPPCTPELIKGKTVFVTVHDTIHDKGTNPKPVRVDPPRPTKPNLAGIEDPCPDSIRTYNLTSKDSMASANLLVEGNLIRYELNHINTTTTIYRTDTLVITKKVNKPFGINAGAFIQRDLNITVGAMLDVSFKGYHLGVMANPFLSQQGLFFTVPIR